MKNNFLTIFCLFFVTFYANAQTYTMSREQLRDVIDPTSLRPGQVVSVLTNDVILTFKSVVGSNAIDYAVDFNSVKRPGYKWVANWGGDPRAFGVKFGNSTTNDMASNQAGLVATVAYARTTGIPIVCPPGICHILGDLDISGISRFSGTSDAWNSGKFTNFRICQKGASFLINVTLNTKISSFLVQPMFLSFIRDDTTSTAITTASVQNDIIIEDINVYGMYRGIKSSSFDSSIKDFTFAGVQGLYLPGGTHNDFTRIALRGMVPACSTNSSVIVKIPSYTAGSTNVTVTDGQPLRAGDFIMCPVATATGYSNPLQAKLWARRVESVSGNDITISNPWPTSFTNGEVYYLLGAGTYAVYCTTENQFQALNIEWGSWDNVMYLVGPGSYNVDSIHVEGIGVYKPGIDASMFGGDNSSLTIGYLNIVNCTVLSTTGYSLFNTASSYIAGNIYIRDVDQFQATKQLYVAKTRSGTRSAPIKVGYLGNYGVPFARPPEFYYEYQGTTYDGGDNQVIQERVGTTNMHFYGYSTTPTYGAFVRGDRLFFPTNTLVVENSGTFGSPLGTYRIRTNSQVLVTDATGRGYVGQRTALLIGSTTLVAERPAIGGAVVMTLASNAVAGDRWVYVDVASGATGDWGVIGLTNSVYEDVCIQRLHTESTPDRVYLSLPLATNHSAGTLFETGTKMYGASSVDVSTSTSIAYPTPTFLSPLQANSVGSFSATGAVTFGNSTLGTSLTVRGGAAGARNFVIERSGTATNGIGVGLDSFSFIGENPTRGIFSVNNTTNESALYLGSSTTFGLTAARKGQVLSQRAPSGSTDAPGGDLEFYTGEGTGAGAPAKIKFLSTVTTAAGATLDQPRRTALEIQHPVLPNITNNTAISLYYTDTNGALTKVRLVITNEAGLLRAVFIP